MSGCKKYFSIGRTRDQGFTICPPDQVIPTEGWVIYGVSTTNETLFILDGEGNQLATVDTYPPGVGDDIHTLRFNEAGDIVGSNATIRYFRYTFDGATVSPVFSNNSSRFHQYAAEFDEDGNIYFGGQYLDGFNDEFLHAYTAGGGLRWRYAGTLHNAYGTIALAGNGAQKHLYYHAISGLDSAKELGRVAADTGANIWRITPTHPPCALTAFRTGDLVALMGDVSWNFGTSHPLGGKGTIVARYDQDGNLVWPSGQIVLPGVSELLDICTDFDENFYVTGDFGGNGIIKKFSGGSATEDPALLWTASWGSGRGEGYRIATDGILYVLAGTSAGWIQKHNITDGSLVWAKHVQDSGTFRHVTALDVHPGNVALF